MAHRHKDSRQRTSTAANSRRSRGFGGCSTCRRKRMKCDEQKPRCSACISQSVLCAYEKNLFFELDGHLGSGEARYRRPILTEEERRLMSECLTASVDNDSALTLLSEIEEKCETTSMVGDFQVCRGPFGAFRSFQSSEGSNSKNSKEFVKPVYFSDEQSVDFDSMSADQVVSPNTLALASDFFEQPDCSDILFPMQEPWGFPLDGSRIQELFDDMPLPDTQQPQVQTTNPGWSAPPITSPSDLLRPSTTTLPTNMTAINNAAVPDKAVPLLQHYQTTVLRSLTPFRHSKTPWHVLFLPQAKNCLAALTLGDHVDSATLCAFYGTLAISAFSLSSVSYSAERIDVAQGYKQLARHHVRLTLQSAYDVPKKAKYKAVLIALLTMVQLSVISGSPDQVETYFLEAEKFIRLRGLNRRKSRKVRLLHHCYAFERILYESTLLADPTGGHRYNVRKAIEESGTVVIGQDALSFRLGQWTNLEQAMCRIKDTEEGENDLHLQNPGAWSATLYPEIFGVPEQILLLLSLVVRLAREKENDQQGIGLTLTEFLARAKAIEQLIQRWQLPRPGSDLDNLQHAMHLALSIYFYRRIYDVESSILQDKVHGVLKCLIQSQSLQEGDSFGAARYNWPAFIAAREATDTTTQSSFSNWLKEAARHTGLRLFTTTLQRVESVWQASFASGIRDIPVMEIG